LVAYVARELDEGRDVPPDAYIVCKVAGSEWLWRAADDLVQFLGGRGYIETNIAAQLLRDARVTRILEGPTEALTMFLGTRVVNDGASLHRFLGEGLGEPALSTRLAAVADELRDRCLNGTPRFGSRPEALRWAHALVGQVAIDAVLLAATPRSAPPHVRAWAEQHFERSIATARAQASASGFSLQAEDVVSLADGYAASIGDVEQSLDGEDHGLDEMLRRGDGPRPRSRVARMPASARAEGVTTPAPLPHRPQADAAAIEQFIVRRLSVELKMPESAIDVGRSFFDYGVDSVTAVTLTASLEQWLDLDINPEIVYEIPGIRAFAIHLQEQCLTAAATIGHAGGTQGRPVE
jgi:acyl carrier protein